MSEFAPPDPPASGDDAGAPAVAPTRRLFVALALPMALRARLWTDAAALRDRLGRSVSWTREENLHLTLRFLGEQPEAIVAPLVQSLVGLGERCPAPTLTLGGLGAFPGRSRPRVLWVGVEANAALAALYQAVDDACAALGLGREARAFHPHLTLGRVRPGPRVDAGALADAEPALRGPYSLSVHTVDLMQSELARTGARYTRLHAAPLRAPADRVEREAR